MESIIPPPATGSVAPNFFPVAPSIVQFLAKVQARLAPPFPVTSRIHPDNHEHQCAGEDHAIPQLLTSAIEAYEIQHKSSLRSKGKDQLEKFGPLWGYVLPERVNPRGLELHQNDRMQDSIPRSKQIARTSLHQIANQVITMHIHLLPDLVLSSNGPITLHDLRCSEENRSVSFRQGDLDGGCGPYSAMMALMIMGAIKSRAEVYGLWENTVLDRRTSWSKALHEKRDGSIPIFSGTTASDMISLIEAAQKSLGTAQSRRVQATAIFGKNEDQIETVIHHIDESKCPVILSVDWNGGGAHWVTVVGYQTWDGNSGPEDDDSMTENLLLLDPGSESQKVTVWNAVLSTSRKSNKKYPFEYWSNQFNQQCKITEAILLSFEN